MLLEVGAVYFKDGVQFDEYGKSTAVTTTWITAKTELRQGVEEKVQSIYYSDAHQLVIVVVKRKKDTSGEKPLIQLYHASAVKRMLWYGEWDALRHKLGESIATLSGAVQDIRQQVGYQIGQVENQVAEVAMELMDAFENKINPPPPPEPPNLGTGNIKPPNRKGKKNG